MPWFPRHNRTAPPAARRPRLNVEALEDRSVPTASAISATLDGQSVAAGSTPWLSAVMKVSGLGAAPVTIHLDGATFTGPGFSAHAPSAAVTFSPTARTATTGYDAGTDTWSTTAPSGLGGNVFLDGLALPAPPVHGPVTVTWGGNFATDTPGVTVTWQWSAADYTRSVPADYNALNVKPCDDPFASQYQNTDRAGTPEALKPGLLGGLIGSLLPGFPGGPAPTVASSGAATVTPDRPAAPASLAGVVYNDANRNGVLDPGEGGIQGVTVTLTGTDDLGNAVSLSVDTDQNGAYSFTGLRPGTYTLTASLAPSCTATGASPGTVDGTQDGVAASASQVTQIVLGAGKNGVGYGFGEASNFQS
jgi:hypothetical protein